LLIVPAPTVCPPSRTANPSPASLAILQAGWDDPDLREVTRETILDAKNKLPVIEVAATRDRVDVRPLATHHAGPQEPHEDRHSRCPDGAFTMTETTEWYDANSPLRAVVGLFSPVVPTIAPGQASIGDEDPGTES
jgi:hypothetical protein